MYFSMCNWSSNLSHRLSCMCLLLLVAVHAVSCPLCGTSAAPCIAVHAVSCWLCGTWMAPCIAVHAVSCPLCGTLAAPCIAVHPVSCRLCGTLAALCIAVHPVSCPLCGTLASPCIAVHPVSCRLCGTLASPCIAVFTALIGPKTCEGSFSQRQCYCFIMLSSIGIRWPHFIIIECANRPLWTLWWKIRLSLGTACGNYYILWKENLHYRLVTLHMRILW